MKDLRQNQVDPSSKQYRRNYEMVERFIQFLLDTEQTMTEDRDVWFRVGQALAATFNEEDGFYFFAAISSLDSNYDYEAVVERWNDAVNNRTGSISFGTFVAYTKSLGFDPLDSEKNIKISEYHGVQFSDIEKGMLSFSEDIYDNLPSVLREFTEIFRYRGTRDIVLLSALGALGSLLTNVSILHRGKRIYPTLFTFVAAPPASGKGDMNSSKGLVYPAHKMLKIESEDALTSYREELEAYNAAKKEGNAGDLEAPVRPNYIYHIIPVDSSASSFIDQLDQNDGVGLLFSTEADVLASNRKQEWGLKSEMIRNLTEHEPISSSRGSGEKKRVIEVEEPKCSIVLSGTIAQIKRLISDPEDGTFSRGLFLIFDDNTGYRVEEDDLDIASEVAPLALRVKCIYEKLRDFGRVEVKMTLEQKVEYDELQNFWEEETTKMGGVYARSFARRMSANLKRVIAITTILRHEHLKLQETILCSDEDFALAKEIIKTLRIHSQIVFDNYIGKPDVPDLSDKLILLKNALPEEFTTKDAKQVCDEIGISQGRCQDDLRKLVHFNVVEKYKYGHYRKVA